MPHGARAVRLLLLLLFAALMTGGEAFAGPRVVLVTGERSGAHEETLDALRSALGPDVPAHDIGIVETRQLDSGMLGEARIIVTIGTQAAKAVGTRNPKQPVLNILLPRDAYESLQTTLPNQRSSAIFLDQPAQRLIALLGAALPDRATLALLAGPATEELSRRVASAARERHLRVSIEQVASHDEIYPALERLLAEPTVLLALPDSTVFNSYTIQNVLLTSYRNRTPLIGFSPAYVRAGALLALYSTPAQIARQAAEAVRGVLAGGGLPPPQSPREFEVATNPNVARSLGIELESGERIVARIRLRESQRETKP